MKSEIVVCGIPFGTPQETDALHYVREHGFTSVQLYTHWRRFEPERRGDFRWDFYDQQVRAIQEAGLKFVPFLPMGSKYSMPDWWLDDPGHRTLVCLEHGKASQVESIWNPLFRQEVERVMAAFAQHYRPWDVLESVQPGISGDYGEAIFPVMGNWPGDYHTHEGFWCGGEDAAASFRTAMQARYGTIGSLNASWRTGYACFDEVRPFLREQQPSRTAYFDFLQWYSGSMTAYAGFWMACCRRHFPGTPVYLCTGGVESPAQGADFAAQAQIAARHGGGLRLTNEGNNFYRNLHDTIHAHSACAFYGAYLGLEPVGPILPEGVTSRMYGSAAYGNRQIFHYFRNLTTGEQPYTGAGDNVYTYRSLIRERCTRPRITLFWPMDESRLNGTAIPSSILHTLTALRRHYEVNVADERMILDGALQGTRLLILLDTASARAEALEAIEGWVRSGGVLLANCRTRSLELEPVAAFDAVFGITPDSEEAWGHTDYTVVPTDWAPAVSAVPTLHSAVGWLGLAEGVQPLFRCAEQLVADTMHIRACYAAFTNRYGHGRGVYFAGPLDLDATADAVFSPSPAFSRLLEDCARAFGGVAPFILNDGEIARTRIDGRTLVLREDHTIVWE